MEFVISIACLTHFAFQFKTSIFISSDSAFNVQSHTRAAVIKSLKKQNGEHLDCTVVTMIIEESADYMVAKITMKFKPFTKTDFVTLEREENNWKVSKSNNLYQTINN